MNLEKLQETLCANLCTDINLVRQDDLILIETPFLFSDGDSYQMYLQPVPTGGIRVTDCGHTLMHMSYTTDINLMNKGSRKQLLRQIQSECDLTHHDDEFYIETTADQLHTAIFNFGKAITKIHDMTFLNRVRVANTFYEDLEREITAIIPSEQLTKDFTADIERADDYVIDYAIKRPTRIFLFGVPNRDKAQLATITIERLLRYSDRIGKFRSLIVFCDDPTMSHKVLRRLTNISDASHYGVDAQDISRKVDVLSPAA